MTYIETRLGQVLHVSHDRNLLAEVGMILSEQHIMIRDMARQFAAEHLAPYAAEWDQTATVPLNVLKEMGNLGLLGMLVPEAWGGAGLDYLSYVLALEQIAGGDGGGLHNYERQQLAGVLHLDRLRHHRAESSVSATFGPRRDARRLRPN